MLGRVQGEPFRIRLSRQAPYKQVARPLQVSAPSTVQSTFQREDLEGFLKIIIFHPPFPPGTVGKKGWRAYMNFFNIKKRFDGESSVSKSETHAFN